MTDAPARATKTSLTHPLPIPAVSTPGGGMIGMSMCPGKSQPDAITGPWDRDLVRDLEAIQTFGAKFLITLMEADELGGAHVPTATLAAAVEAAGLTWRHWPIVDFAAPDVAFERLWKTQAGEVCDHLAAGRRVVVHCRGGRGRSGLVAVRLLIELGLKPGDAITTVRAVQPLAMETSIQEEHVRSYRAVLNLPSGL